VCEVVQLLGLSDCADTMIGGARLRGISGGERKRLSFASEFLTDPAILFCDEPTSGLDSFMAESMMELLGSLARLGKTVITTIHQPSSQVFSKLDQLLLLAEGRTAYLGPAPAAKQFFSSIGLDCPSDYNPADHLVREVAVVPGKEEESRERVGRVCEQFQQSGPGQAAVEVVAAELPGPAKLAAAPLWVSPYKASWGQQFTALLWRNLLAVLKDPLVARVRCIQCVVLGLILGTIYWQHENNQAGIKNSNGALFFIVTNISFANIFAICNSFAGELPLFLREHEAGMYRTDTYFLSKQLVELPLHLLETTVLFTIIYWMAGLNPDPIIYFTGLGIVLLTLQVVISLGYFLSCVAPNIDFALAVAPVLVLPFMLFGGFYLDVGSVPVWLSWLQYLSWFWYAFSALLINQWSGLEDIECEEVGFPCLTSGQQVLATNNLQQEDFSFNLVMLAVLALVMRLAAFLVLYLKARRK